MRGAPHQGGAEYHDCYAYLITKRPTCDCSVLGRRNIHAQFGVAPLLNGSAHDACRAPRAFSLRTFMDRGLCADSTNWLASPRDASRLAPDVGRIVCPTWNWAHTKWNFVQAREFER